MSYYTIGEYLYGEKRIVEGYEPPVLYETVSTKPQARQIHGPIQGIRPPPYSPPYSAPRVSKEPYQPSVDSRETKPGTIIYTDPKIWGPPYWESLHTTAAFYPKNPSPIVRERMKSRILAIPFEVPCAECRVHASSFIEENKDRLDTIVSNRHELGQFYTDFHNKVNKRYGKPEWKYRDVYYKYTKKYPEQDV